MRKSHQGAVLLVALVSAFLLLPGVSARPTTPSGIVEYVPITITNSQSASTPAPFQQMITMSSTAYGQFEAANLDNVEFFNSSGGLVPSWLESGNSNSATDTIYWLSMDDGIKAGESTTIYMGFASIGTNLFDGKTVGEAPELSSTYGQYDNGAGIFTFYDNFSGTALNSTNWVSSGSSHAVDNGLTLTVGSNYNTVTTTASLVAPYAIDYYGRANADSGIYFNVQDTHADSNSYLWAQRQPSEFDQFYAYNPENGGASLGEFSSPYGQYTSYAWWGGSADSNLHVYTLMDGQSNDPLVAQTDYATKETLASMPSIYVGGHFRPRAYYGIQFWQWVRARAMPPGAVMPSVSFGELAPNPSTPPFVNQLPPASTSVNCTPSPVELGSTSTCTATVKGSAPTGIAAWSSESGSFSPPSCLLTGGACSVSFTPSSAATPASITASYGGDANNGPSSTVVTLLVHKSATTVSATCSPSSTFSGAIVTCKASVAGVSPTGSVAWSSSAGGTFVPSQTCPLSGGSCKVFFSPSTDDSSATVAATYSGDSNNVAGSGNFSLTVSPVSVPSTVSVNTSTSVATNSGAIELAAVTGLAAAAVIAVAALAAIALSSKRTGSARTGYPSEPSEG